MRTKRIVISCVMLLMTARLFAQAGAFVAIPTDTRSVAMGNTFLAADNGNGVYSNLAALSLGEQKMAFDLNYRPWVADLSDDYSLFSFSADFSLSDKHRLSLGMRSYTLPSYTLSDDYGNTSGSYEPKEYSLDLGYAYNVSEKTALSLALHFIDADYGESYSASTAAFDLGFATRFNDELTLGAMVRNVGGTLDFDSSESELPLTFAAGVEWNKALAEKHQLKLAFDASALSYNDASGLSGGLGVEYLYNGLLALRGGYYYADEELALDVLTMGCGIQLKGFAVDFAYLSSDNALSNNYSISCSWTLFKHHNEEVE